MALDWGNVCVQHAGLQLPSVCRPVWWGDQGPKGLQGSEALHNDGEFLPIGHVAAKPLCWTCTTLQAAFPCLAVHWVLGPDGGTNSGRCCTVWVTHDWQLQCTVPSSLLATFHVPSKFGPCSLIPARLQEPLSRFDDAVPRQCVTQGRAYGDRVGLAGAAAPGTLCLDVTATVDVVYATQTWESRLASCGS